MCYWKILYITANYRKKCLQIKLKISIGNISWNSIVSKWSPFYNVLIHFCTTFVTTVLIEIHNFFLLSFSGKYLLRYCNPLYQHVYDRETGGRILLLSSSQCVNLEDSATSARSHTYISHSAVHNVGIQEKYLN